MLYFEGQVIEIQLERIADRTKSQGFLHWISVDEAVKCETRLYDYLFNVYDPNELENYIDGINPDSKHVYKNSLMNKYLIIIKHLDNF